MCARAEAASDAVLLASAVALRWSRPDLTAALAEHVAGMGNPAGTGNPDDRTWVAAAGWLVHGSSAVGDGRERASDALAELARRDPALLDEPAADRLRIEVAALAASQREHAVARLLVEPLLASDRSPEVRADALGVVARCMVEERPGAVVEAIRRAEAEWHGIGGSDAGFAEAGLALLSAVALRRSGHLGAAADRAAEGLSLLEGLDWSSPHLAAALTAEWITALIEAGQADEAHAGCRSAPTHLQASGRPSRQVALLRLATARALAESTASGAFEALEQAAHDAASCDTPDLEGLCLATLGTLWEQSGRLDAALEAMRRGLAAQRRDRARSERFRAALRAMAISPASDGRAANLPGPSGHHAPPSVITSEEAPHPAVAVVDGPWATGRWTGGASSVVVEDGGGEPRAGHRRADPVVEDPVCTAPPAAVSNGAVPDPLFGPLPAVAVEEADEGTTDAAHADDRDVAGNGDGGAVEPQGAGAPAGGIGESSGARPLPVVHAAEPPPAPPVVPASGGDAVGSVVVIDVVRGGTRVDGGRLLGVLREHLVPQTPDGARLRVEDDGSALAMALGGREPATGWMYGTLPAMFEAAAGHDIAAWPTGTSLRATVHDTAGPVGAQLLHRLDRVVGGRRDGAAPMRSGVPVLAGSGGRRRRAEDDDAAPWAYQGAATVRSMPRRHAAGMAPASIAPASVVEGRVGRHRQERSGARQDRLVGTGALPEPPVPDDIAARTPVPDRASSAERAVEVPNAPVIGIGDDPAVPGTAGTGAADPAVSGGVMTDRAADAEEEPFSVEGLGLADLLAGALAAYSRI